MRAEIEAALVKEEQERIQGILGIFNKKEPAKLKMKKRKKRKILSY